MPQSLPIHHSVSLRQAQATRVVRPPQTTPTDPEPAFEDTVPLLFRSEAFAEDFDSLESAPAMAHLPRRLDTHMLEAGAAVLRMTLAALTAPRLPPVPPLPRTPRRATGWV